MTTLPSAAGTRARSYSGDYLDLTDPDWRDVNLDDVARALAGIRRWNAHTRRPLSIAEHSLIAADLVARRMRLATLLHDGHEYMVGDLTRPLVRTLDVTLGGDARVSAALDVIKYRVDVAICRQLFHACQVPLVDPDLQARQLADDMRSTLVKTVDDAMAAAERRELWFGPDLPAHAHRIIPTEAPDEERVAAAWLAAVREEIGLVYTGDGLPPVAAAAFRLGMQRP